MTDGYLIKLYNSLHMRSYFRDEAFWNMLTWPHSVHTLGYTPLIMCRESQRWQKVMRVELDQGFIHDP